MELENVSTAAIAGYINKGATVGCGFVFDAECLAVSFFHVGRDIYCLASGT